MWAVAKSKKPKLTVHVDAPDIDLLRAASREFPGVSEAFLVRAALRVGLPAVAKSRELMSRPPVDLAGRPLAQEEIRESQQRHEAAAKERAATRHHGRPMEDTPIVGEAEAGLGQPGSEETDEESEDNSPPVPLKGARIYRSKGSKGPPKKDEGPDDRAEREEKERKRKRSG